MEDHCLTEDMSTVQVKKLGEKYVLLDLIGIGGMAEIYRAKLLGDKGFEKQIVIKKLLPQVAQDKELIRLFIGEARLAALLQHDNIAATYDFGEIDGDFFLAMEYLSGKDLYTVLQRAREHKRPLAIKDALVIASKICEGMDYAHRLKDLQGKPLNIIHRDLTPHNIFITYDGKIKIFDFGVAKAEMLDNRTRAGVVKGKLSYMSPEQLSGEVIDFRSDIFSIGILLYEMLSGRRMYTGDTATLIKKCITVDYDHLENIAPDLPSELYAILHKALARDLESRYQGCADMQADIDDFMFSIAERADSKGLKNYIRSLFAKEVVSDLKKEVTFTEKTVAYDANLDAGSSAPFSFCRLKDSRLWTEKKYILPALACLVILITFLLPGLSKKDDSPVADSPVNQKAMPHTETRSRQGTVTLFPQQKRKVLEVQSQPEAGGGNAANIEHEKQREAEKHVQERIQEKKKNAMIRKLAKIAKQRFSENKLTTPAGDSAYFYYNKIMNVDPGNSLAKSGYKKIADRYAFLADKAFRKFDLVAAEKYVNRGLYVMPDNSRLLALKVDLTKSPAEKIMRGVEKNIDTLFSY